MSGSRLATFHGAYNFDLTGPIPHSGVIMIEYAMAFDQEIGDPQPHSLPATAVTIPVAHSTTVLRSLGPRLVTGAADDDPSGIATYSQVRAQFGYGLA